MTKIQFHTDHYIYINQLLCGDLEIFDSNKELITKISCQNQPIRILKSILLNKIDSVTDFITFLKWFAVGTYEGVESYKNKQQVLCSMYATDLKKLFNDIYKTNYRREIYEHIREIGNIYILCDTEFIYNSLKESEEEVEE